MPVSPNELFQGKATLADVAHAGTAPTGSSAKPPPPPTHEPPPLPAGAVPQRKPPTITKPPASDRKFPCKNCGAKLDFDPSQRALKCPYCGHVEEIAPSQSTVRECDFQAYLGKQAGETAAIAGRSTEVRCPGCQANVLLEDNVVTDACPFCGTHLSNTKPEEAQEQIPPQCILPFALAKDKAIAAFNGWISGLWFAPSDLLQLANIGQLSGVYVPFWTYDSMTYSHYTGQRGDDYWDTETYTETDAEGHSVTRTREVRKTRWTYVSGEVDHFFDDVLVCASRSLPENYVTKLEPWDLQDLESFKADFLAGFKTERYTVTLGDGFSEAQQIMTTEIRQLCEQDIGGDHQRLSDVSTQHVGVTFKHLLLPIWLAVYRYNNNTYRILVNARTGDVTGTRPWSALKITLAVLAGLVVLGIVIALVASNQGHH